MDKRFKPYLRDQGMLLPLSFDELIADDDLVRVVDSVIDGIDTSVLEGLYPGGGAPGYHPVMLLKVITYAYCSNIYSSRQIENQLKQNVHFMWLSGMTRVDHTTIARFRSNRIASVFETVFVQVVQLLIEQGYIQFENYFLDGTIIEANANRYTHVWRKNVDRWHDSLRRRVHNHLQIVDELQADEDARFSGIEPALITAQMIRDTAEVINREIKAGPDHGEDGDGSGFTGRGSGGGAVRKKRSIAKKLAVDGDTAARYEGFESVFDGRNSFSKTDPDATFMRMKEDMRCVQAKPKPGYNIQIGTENQFVVCYTAHHVSNDQTTLIPHLDHLNDMFGRLPATIVADAGYGCEENYAYLEDFQLENMVKYPSWYREVTHKLDRFNKDVWEYDSAADEYTCPSGRKLVFVRSSVQVSAGGYEKQMSHYESENCTGCEFVNACIKTSSVSSGSRRSIKTSRRNHELIETVRTNLSTDRGQQLRAKRRVEVETVFADIKANFGLRRFTHRGKTKILVEWGLTSLAHNLKKLSALQKAQPAT